MYQEIIKFWFEDIEPSQWWVKSDDFDLLTRERFASVHAQAVRGELFAWRETAEGRLAEILVLDQFARNMFHNDPKAFAADPQAHACLTHALTSGFDKDLTQRERNGQTRNGQNRRKLNGTTKLAKPTKTNWTKTKRTNTNDNETDETNESETDKGETDKTNDLKAVLELNNIDLGIFTDTWATDETIESLDFDNN